MKIFQRIKHLIKAYKSLEPSPIIVKNISPAKSEILKGRKILITGGTSGIGYAIAVACVRAGASVVITGRSKDRVEKAVENLKSLVDNTSSVAGYIMDVSDVNDLTTKISNILHQDQWNNLDTLVNNAGIGGGVMPNATSEEFDKVLSTNLKGAFFLSQIFAKHLISNKIQGNILNISSSSSVRPAISAYNISKWGLNGLTLGLAKALIPYGITVNGLAPGPCATPMLLKDNSNLSLPNSPIGRYILPEEIANMAVVLISPIGKCIIGDTVFMTGGAGVITFDDINTSF